MSSPADRVLECIRRRGKAPTFELVKETGLKWAEVVDALAELEKSGAVARAGFLDPAKPLSTTVWAYVGAPQAKAPEGIGAIAGIVLNPPLLRDLGRTPAASMGLMDSLDYIIQEASEHLRIMMPYIGDLMSVLFTQHLSSVSKLRAVRVITEDAAGNRAALEPLKTYMPNLQVLYATKRTDEGVKVLGAHAKLIIADEKVALVGTFNLTQAHLLVNYDVGLLVKGKVVSYLREIYDAIWSAQGAGSRR